MSEAVRETSAMIAGMAPRLDEREYVFCAMANPGLAVLALALACFRENEGVSLILERTVAAGLRLDVSSPMRRIVLEVHSALDGVGLTAAVASALSANAIPCNMVAAFHHDHVFVPADKAEAALDVLRKIQSEAASTNLTSSRSETSAESLRT